ncbi:MAG: tRNA (adenosine(37)-N6)-threonylcarbamoyltransferase complex transferase subunit TsaD [Candidatus Omnitrophica bacterium]|nr:tRNA (adenosine(37)-N6)-threonylcarbamoyltransferase complex transferase subunit TsaD [Candidatus Omnitrophota bacterium]
MYILGIETSCDETSAAIVKNDKTILSNKIASSLNLHKKYGGVVPEIACRHHLECINYVIKEALEEAGVKFKDIDLIAVTHGPGLVGALLIGLSAAKAISYALSVPLVGVNHLYAHVYSAFMSKENKVRFPATGLIVSGGHTTLVSILGYNKFKLIGQTRDDAAGEAFDKAAKVLGIGYPGGPEIEKKAKNGNPQAIRFPRAYMEKGSFDFSFSGVKTALLYYVTRRGHPAVGRSNQGVPIGDTHATINDVCASFQAAIFDVIVDKAIAACKKQNTTQLFVGGGVSINKTLQDMLIKKATPEGIKVFLPAKGLFTDNAAMVAAAGYRLYKEGIRSNYSLEAEPNLGIG